MYVVEGGKRRRTQPLRESRSAPLGGVGEITIDGGTSYRANQSQPEPNSLNSSLHMHPAPGMKYEARPCNRQGASGGTTLRSALKTDEAQARKAGRVQR